MISLLEGDCLSRLKTIECGSIDAVIADPPYGTTACKWDEIIDYSELWSELFRVGKPDCPFVFFSAQPFTFDLVASNRKNFKYSWVWKKNFSTNFLHAKRQPLRNTEDIVVFYRKSGKYYPQKSEGHPPTQSAKGFSEGKLWSGVNKRDYKGGDTTRFPTSILEFDAVDQKNRIHPTQKPIELLKYLLRTYTLENETVLDFCMGSGSMGEACLEENRNFIGIEKDHEIFVSAKTRLEKFSLFYT